MFAIDHAATALVLKRRFPDAPLPALLLSVQLSELLWAGLNLLGIERVTTGPEVRSVADIHLAVMPWSHSVATMLGAALLIWLLPWALGRPRLGLALGAGVASHLVLDLLTHDHDLTLAPGLGGHLGLGLYGSAPMAAFFLELAYGVLCWWVFRGSRALLALLVGANVANLTFFSAALPGPEQLLANHPTAVVLLVLAQIAATLTLVGLLAGSKGPPQPPFPEAARRALSARGSMGGGFTGGPSSAGLAPSPSSRRR